MKTLFRPLFTVSLSHTYYPDGVCKDFDFVIPADTLQGLNNGKLIAKVREGKLYVFFEVGEAKQPLVSIAGQTLRFGLKLRNPFFNNFTEPYEFNSSRTPVYSNFSTPNGVTVQGVILTGPILSHSLLPNIRPDRVTLKNTHGNILQTVFSATTNDDSTISYSLSGQATGLYTIEEFYPSEIKMTPYYFDSELQREGIFSMIEINLDEKFYTTVPEFKITFNAKQETLKYYLVVAKNNNINQLSIIDAGDKLLRFKSRAPASDDKYASSLNNERTQVVLFESEGQVKRQANARKKIQLNNNGNILIDNLPQPAVNQANADLIIHLSKP